MPRWRQASKHGSSLDVDDVRGELRMDPKRNGYSIAKEHINIRIDHDVLEWF